MMNYGQSFILKTQASACDLSVVLGGPPPPPRGGEAYEVG